jgi:hypothetical protein
VITGFRLEMDETSALLGRYAAINGNFLLTFRRNISGPFFSVKDPMKMGPISCPDASVSSYHYSLRNDLEERCSRTYGLF